MVAAVDRNNLSTDKKIASLTMLIILLMEYHYVLLKYKL